jgi:hypothetical protein
VDREQLPELNAIEGDATLALRQPRGLVSISTSRLIYMLARPSFDDHVSWEILRGGPKDRFDYLAVRRSWLRTVDSAKLSSPVERLRHPTRLKPTMKLHVAEPPSEWVVQRLEALHELRIAPIAEDNVVVLDGVSKELELYTLQGHVRYHWNHAPGTWAQLDDWFWTTFNQIEAMDRVRREPEECFI